MPELTAERKKELREERKEIGEKVGKMGILAELNNEKRMDANTVPSMKKADDIALDRKIRAKNAEVANK